MNAKVKVKISPAEYAGNGSHLPGRPAATYNLHRPRYLADGAAQEAIQVDVELDFPFVPFRNVSASDIQVLVKDLLKQYPLIVIDDEVLGEPRIRDTRMPVSIVLTALVEYGGFDQVREEYENTYSEKELKAAVNFARDFIERCYERSRYTSITR